MQHRTVETIPLRVRNKTDYRARISERNKYTLENKRITDNNFVTRRRYAISLLIAHSNDVHTGIYISLHEAFIIRE